MNFFKKILKSIFIITFITSLILLALFQRNRQIRQQVLANIPSLEIPSPTMVFSLPIQTESLGSPDGSKTLIMKKEQIKDKVKYTFFVDELIFQKEEVLQSLVIPYNAWSPDNKYIFLKESGASINNYYVFYASGDLFSENVKYLNIQNLFEKKVNGFVIQEVTGWAAPNLIIINTVSSEGNRVSFWFDVPSQSFIQLGTYFN